MKPLNIKNGTIQFWGEWFGRPYDNYHQVVETHWINNGALIINFDQGEVATIYDPTNIISSEKEFSIDDASLITFEWFYYGREHTIENLCCLEYKRINNTKILCIKTDTQNREFCKNGSVAMKIV